MYFVNPGYMCGGMQASPEVFCESVRGGGEVGSFGWGSGGWHWKYLLSHKEGYISRLLLSLIGGPVWGFQWASWMMHLGDFGDLQGVEGDCAPCWWNSVPVNEITNVLTDCAAVYWAPSELAVFIDKDPLLWDITSWCPQYSAYCQHCPVVIQ